MTQAPFELVNDVSVEDLEELIDAIESIRGDLATRLQAMTAEATGLWTTTARQSARIAELEAALQTTQAPETLSEGEAARLQRLQDAAAAAREWVEQQRQPLEARTAQADAEVVSLRRQLEAERQAAAAELGATRGQAAELQAQVDRLQAARADPFSPDRAPPTELAAATLAEQRARIAALHARRAELDRVAHA